MLGLTQRRSTTEPFVFHFETGSMLLGSSLSWPGWPQLESLLPEPPQLGLQVWPLPLAGTAGFTA